MPRKGGVRILLQTYPSCSMQLLQQSLGSMDGGVKQGVWLLPHPVQVIPPQVAPVVAKGYTIWVKHWHYLYDYVYFRTGHVVRAFLCVHVVCKRCTCAG
jgi:hypothetical protein